MEAFEMKMEAVCAHGEQKVIVLTWKTAFKAVILPIMGNRELNRQSDNILKHYSFVDDLSMKNLLGHNCTEQVS